MSQEFVELKILLNEHFTFLEGRFRAIDERFATMETEIRSLREQVKHQERRIDILTEHVDDFITLHRTLDTELAASRARTERLEARVTKLEEARS